MTPDKRPLSRSCFPAKIPQKLNDLLESRPQCYGLNLDWPDANRDLKAG